MATNTTNTFTNHNRINARTDQQQSYNEEIDSLLNQLNFNKN